MLGTNESKDTKASMDSQHEIREWFTSLSAEDRALVCRFADESFLKGLSRVAAFLLTGGEGEPTKDRVIRTDSSFWMAQILPQNISELFLTPTSEGDTSAGEKIEGHTPICTDSKKDEKPGDAGADAEGGATKPVADNIEVVNKEVVVGTGVLADTLTNVVDKDSEEFRIRAISVAESDQVVDTIPSALSGSEELPSESLSSAALPVDTGIIPAAETGDAGVSETVDSESKILSMMTNICFMLPTTRSPGSGDQLGHTVGLHPSYSSTIGGNELLLAFDEIMAPQVFLSGPIIYSWSDAVLNLAKGQQTPVAIPVYMLLLLRLQISIFNAYRTSLRSSNKNLFVVTENTIEAKEDEGKSHNNVTSGTIPTSEATNVEMDKYEAAIVPEPNDKSLPPEVQVVGAVTQVGDALKSSVSNDVACVNGPPKGADALPDGAMVVCGEDTVGEKEWRLVPLTEFLEQSSKQLTTVENMTGTLVPGNMPISKQESGNDDVKDSSPRTIHPTTPSVEDKLSMDENLSTPTAAGTHDSPDAADESTTTSPQAKQISKKKKKKKVSSSREILHGSLQDGEAHGFPPSIKKRKGSVASNGPQGEASDQATDNASVSHLADGNAPVVARTPDKVETSTQTEDSACDVPLGTISLTLTHEANKPKSAIVSESGSPDSGKTLDDGAVVRPAISVEGSNDGAEESESTLGSNRRLLIPMAETGSAVVTPSVSGTKESTNREEDDAGPSNTQSDSQDEWETVEIRSRGNRKKPGDRSNQGRHGSYSQHPSWNGNGSKKKAPRNAESRRRIQKRKMVREILSSVLDAVDEQVRRRRPVAADPTPRPPRNPWAITPVSTVGKGTFPPKPVASVSQRKEEPPKRDIVAVKQEQELAKGTSSQQSAQRKHQQSRLQPGTKTDASKTNREKAIVSPIADQSTVPTLPETVSAVSTGSAFTEAQSKVLPRPSGLARSESSSGGSVEATKRQSNAKNSNTEASPSPPLPTLLSPGNANSATSSVASSLDAPHTVHHSHHTSYLGNENDVGYHLLHVCNRLTRDIGQFMKRREQALSVRRRERGLVLGALQETLMTIWPGMCQVEMYGSCATDLDLPSSDLDVVVRGLDTAEQNIMRNQNSVGTQPFDGSYEKHQTPAAKEGRGAGEAVRSSGQMSHPQRSPHTSPHPGHFSAMYGHMSPNAERVVQLAMELEQQPWAVHVKAIPTASVPVIKILADPARLPGATVGGNGEWLVQYPTTSQTPQAGPGANEGSEMPVYPGNQSQPWRGADVVNGLLKVDITFEGPEHGGIGSTIFSSEVVKKFSQETGLPPDCTPPVQVLMVLKELLAQRRLNEPFSGGLSSYALLLLVISVVGERSIIRRELERVERQRKMVAAGGGNAVSPVVGDSALRARAKHMTAKASEGKTLPSMSRKQQVGQQSTGGKDGSQQGFKASGQKTIPSKPERPSGPPGGQNANKAKVTENKETLKKGTPASSSWASIAKRTSAAQAPGTVQESSQSATSTPPPAKKLSSFADAVAKGTGPAVNSPAVTGNNKSHITTDPPKVKPQIAPVPSTNSGKRASEVSKASPREIGTSNSSSSGKLTSVSRQEELESLFPQSFHDVVEVLCSGETTSGKLLMHFLLLYGHHFDSHSTAIDYSGTHKRDVNSNNGYAPNSPFLQRRNAGSYDPMTGMLTVDPIVVYDPLEGSEANNVARSCFAWSSIRWVFAQSYMTLSSAVEMSAGSSSDQGIGQYSSPSSAQTSLSQSLQSGQQNGSWATNYTHDESGKMSFDPSSPLLELLLSF